MPGHSATHPLRFEVRLSAPESYRPRWPTLLLVLANQHATNLMPEPLHVESKGYGAKGGDRILDAEIFSLPLYHLSYRRMFGAYAKGDPGLATGARS